MNTSQFNCKICGTNDQNSFRKKKIKNKFYYEKICKKCEAVKALEYYHNNKQKVTEYQKKYLKENSDICKLKKERI